MHVLFTEYVFKQTTQQSTNFNIILPACLLLGAALAVFVILIMIIVLLCYRHKKQRGLVSSNKMYVDKFTKKLIQAFTKVRMDRLTANNSRDSDYVPTLQVLAKFAITGILYYIGAIHYHAAI